MSVPINAGVGPWRWEQMPNTDTLTLDPDTLPAGRELDALVAERVMGLTVVGWDTASRCDGDWFITIGGRLDNRSLYTERAPLFLDRCGCDYVKSEDDGSAYGQTLQGHYSCCLGVVPHYHEDIAAAWQVVEKLREERWTVLVQAAHQENLQACIIVRGRATPFAPSELVLHPTYLESSIRAQAKTVPLAICRAALAAVESLKTEAK